jgi:phosphate transport system substrate-binding protein
MKKMTLVSAVCLAVFAIFSVSHAGVSGELAIVGTGSGSSILKAIGKAFNKQNPEISITVPKSIGSGGGIKAVGNDEYILGRVARDIKGKEKRYGLKRVPFAKMPIVIYVNNSVPMSDITPEQACRIYDGTTRKWEEISKGKGKIRVIRREDGDSSLLILLRSLPGFKDITLTPRSKTTFSDPSTLAVCTSEKNSIAFGTWSDVNKATGVRALKLGRMHPTDPKYPCTGILSLIYKEKNYTGNLKKYIEFISSPAAKKAIAEAGGLPVD